MCGRSAPLSDLTSLYMGTSDQCFAKTERQNGSTSQKKACRIPAHERPRSQSPTPENRLPTVNFFIVQAPVAVVRLGAGAHGPHGVDGSASGAFDAQIKGRPSSKHLVAMSAPDLVVVCSLHFLIVLPSRPRASPDSLCAPLAMGTQPQAETLHDDYSIVWGRGPVVVHRAGGGARNSPASA